MDADLQLSLAELDSIWKSLGIEVTELRPDSGGTILPTTQPPLDEGGALQISLPQLNIAGVDEAPELRLGETLGEGGMGVVKVATQLSLGREVAVKLVRGGEEPTRELAVRSLLREARVTGALEHPNVIPVHALGCDSTGVPMLVMKRVHGEAWSRVLHDDRHPTLESYPGEPLDFHLDVLTQVCNAVSFAHSKGVVHRDLKPQNVMIGEFGEVYVVDWGIAVALRQEPGCVLPLARDIRTVAGTPQYMAPEQATASASRIDERTDVYLLGAVLHEILTGKPRHQASSMLSLMLQAFVSPPAKFDGSVPEELGAICNRATHVEPEERFASVEDFRGAITRFRRHQSSTALSREAGQRLERLRELLARGEHTERHSDVHRLFSECRFGFRHALSTWPENPQARQGLAGALELMARHEIERGDVVAAGALIEEMERPPEELLRAQREAEAREAREREQVERLRRMERQMDPETGRRTRAALAAVISLFSLTPLFAGLGERLGWWRISMGNLALQIGAFVLVVYVAYRLGRQMLLATTINRRFTNIIRVCCCVMLALPPACKLMGIGVHQTVVFILFLATATIGIASVTMERRLIWGFVVYLGCFMLAARYPGAAFEILGAANFTALAHVAFVWVSTPQQEEVEGAARDT
jgi:serine/threonine-protein kinase